MHDHRVTLENERILFPPRKSFKTMRQPCIIFKTIRQPCIVNYNIKVKVVDAQLVGLRVVEKGDVFQCMKI